MPGASATPSARLERLEIVGGMVLYAFCSVGMMVFNKLAITALPLACTLVGIQMAFAVVMMLCAFPSLHFGSLWDVLRWSCVAPFFTGMLLTSIVALEHAPMSMVVVFRVLSPFFSLLIERFLPNPHRISALLVVSMGIMVAGAGVYSAGLPVDNLFSGLPWIIFNMLLAVADRLVQRSMLAQDQAPVDISLSGVTLLNNLWGCMFMLIAAVVLGELQELPVLLKSLGSEHVIWILCSCFVGTCISFTGIFVQKRISATSFLVLINVNKFGIIFLEAFVMGTKTLSTSQIFGGSVAISGGVLYGQARRAIEESAKGETQPLLDKSEKVEKSKS